MLNIMKGYTLISTGRNDNGTFCQNCGRFIFNYAMIRSRAWGTQIRVGLECKDNLCGKYEPKQLSINF